MRYSVILGLILFFVTGALQATILANFTVDTRQGPVSLTVDFDDQSTSNPTQITQWNWDFGDGSTSTDQNPTHTYAQPGLYDVSLTVVNAANETYTEEKLDYILAYDLTVDFTGGPIQGFRPLTVDFEDLTVCLPEESADWDWEWAWDFGDGEDSDDQNPSHTYTECGLFTVSLEVTITPPDPAFDEITGEMTYEDAIWVYGMDAAIILDRSDSMTGQPLISAKNASNQFVQLLNNGDEIAVGSYSNRGTTHYPMTVIASNQEISGATTAVNAIQTWQWTSIGAGIIKGQYLLLDAEHEIDYPPVQGMILLSDGYQNMAPLVNQVMGAIPGRTNIYTLGYRSDCNQTLLQQIAQATGGTYTFANSGNVTQALNNIYNALTGQRSAAIMQDILVPGGEDFTYDVTVDATAFQATFNLMWHEPATKPELRVISPSGVEYREGYLTDSRFEIRDYATQYVLRIDKPEPGVWTVIVENRDISNVPDHFFLSVTEYADLETTLTLPAGDTILGDVVPLKVILDADPANLNVTEAFAEIYDMNDQCVVVPLTREGTDLVFTGVFIPQAEGSYNIRAYLKGDSEKFGLFSRFDQKGIAIAGRGQSTDTGDELEMPRVPMLSANYPNPFNPSTTISFQIPAEDNVKIEIYNIKGQRVVTLADRNFAAGTHELVWNGCDENGRSVGTGFYFYRMTSGDYTKTRKMMLLK